MPQFEARTVDVFIAKGLDGQTAVGPIVKLDAGQVTIQTAGGPVSLEVARLLELSAKEKPTQPPPEPGARVELVDGSSLIAREYTVSDGRAKVSLAEDQVVEVPTAKIASVRLQAQSGEIAAEWSRLLNIKLDNDLLVIRKGDVVDYYKGVLGDVTGREVPRPGGEVVPRPGGEVVQFNLDGEVLPVKRSKVHGLIYYHRPGGTRRSPDQAARPGVPKTTGAVCRITDATGSQWSVRSFALSGDLQWTANLQWTTVGGLKVTRPLAKVTQIDFSRGKIVFLSDLKPESVTFTPYFGTSKDLPVLEKFFGPREDKNLESGPLQLGGKQYSKGLALHSRTKVVYRLPDRFRRFKALAGIDDGVRPHGSVRLVIHGDDRVLLETTLTGNDPPKPVDLDLTGVRRIAILVDFGDKLDVADHLDLCEARIIK